MLDRKGAGAAFRSPGTHCCCTAPWRWGDIFFPSAHARPLLVLRWTDSRDIKWRHVSRRRQGGCSWAPVSSVWATFSIGSSRIMKTLVYICVPKHADVCGKKQGNILHYLNGFPVIQNCTPIKLVNLRDILKRMIKVIAGRGREVLTFSPQKTLDSTA